MSEAKHQLGPWGYHAAIHGQEGVAFVIYPEGTSEPLAEVLARDGAEDIARRMAAAPELLDALEIVADTLQVFVDTGTPPDSVIGKNLTRARAAIAAATGGAS